MTSALISATVACLAARHPCSNILALLSFALEFERFVDPSKRS